MKKIVCSLIITAFMLSFGSPVSFARENPGSSKKVFEKQIRNTQDPLNKMIMELKLNQKNSFLKIRPHLDQLKSYYSKIKEIYYASMKFSTKSSLLQSKIDEMTKEVSRIPEKLPSPLSQSIEKDLQNADLQLAELKKIIMFPNFFVSEAAAEAEVEDEAEAKAKKKSQDGPCTSYDKTVYNEGTHVGDLDPELFGIEDIAWIGRFSVGPVINYSFYRYNLSDKNTSLNAQALGFGAAFRYYTESQLNSVKDSAGRGAKTISQVPKACRATTGDLTGFVADEGNLPKIAPIYSISPTFYIFEDKDSNEVTAQIALNFGLFNDLLSLGIGWNLSGDDSGEWFLLLGPSIGFKF